MRFISKTTNLLVVLKPGLPAQPLTGTPQTPTISVRFKDGVTDVPEGELVDMMKKHPGFNSDYVSAEDTGGKDIYKDGRTPIEPDHVHTELKYGTPEKITSENKPNLSPEMKKIVSKYAVDLAKEMLPGMVEETLKKLVKTNEEIKSEKTTEGKLVEIPVTKKTTKTKSK